MNMNYDKFESFPKSEDANITHFLGSTWNREQEDDIPRFAINKRL